jgi:hypothetical protein
MFLTDVFTPEIYQTFLWQAGISAQLMLLMLPQEYRDIQVPMAK